MCVNKWMELENQSKYYLFFVLPFVFFSSITPNITCNVFYVLLYFTGYFETEYQYRRPFSM